MGALIAKPTKPKPTKRQIIENMISGEYSHPVRVVAFNTAEGWARDVTEDIARAVVSRARNEHRALGDVAQTFVETAIGEDVIEPHYVFPTQAD